METDKTIQQKIKELVDRAKAAQAQIEYATQEQADEMAIRIAWAGVQPEFAQKLAEHCAAETGMGHVPDKYAKLMVKIRGVLRDIKGQKTVGIVEEDKEKGLLKIAKPVGVIGALIPVTNSEATPFVKTIQAVKTRNAIIMAAHPRALKTNQMVTAVIRAVLKKNGWPEDLVINIDEVSVEASTELMKQCDLILATGGAGMVKAAYSSGTPSYGVGAGNAVSIIDDTADLKDAAFKIMRSKTFDNATSCSTENALAIQDNIYSAMIQELQAVGGYLVKPAEKPLLEKAMWIDHILNREIVAQPAAKIAKIAGISLPEGKTFFMVEETQAGSEYPFSHEKLSVVTTLYRWRQFDEAVDLINRITAVSGAGHSCGIHTKIDMRVKELGMKVKVGRVMVNQPQCLANSGAWTNGMPMSMTLGCGTWGGNSTAENITWKHLLNYTWISYPISSTQPTDLELFGKIMFEK